MSLMQCFLVRDLKSDPTAPQAMTSVGTQMCLFVTWIWFDWQGIHHWIQHHSSVYAFWLVSGLLSTRGMVNTQSEWCHLSSCNLGCNRAFSRLKYLCLNGRGRCCHSVMLGAQSDELPFVWSVLSNQNLYDVCGCPLSVCSNIKPLSYTPVLHAKAWYDHLQTFNGTPFPYPSLVHNATRSDSPFKHLERAPFQVLKYFFVSEHISKSKVII